MFWILESFKLSSCLKYDFQTKIAVCYKIEFATQMIDSSTIGWELAAVLVIHYRKVMLDIWR